MPYSPGSTEIIRRIRICDLLGGNGDNAAVDMLLAGGCRVEENGGKTAGDVEVDSLQEPCFWVCQPAVDRESGCCCCCCCLIRSFRTCFSLKVKDLLQ